MKLWGGGWWSAAALSLFLGAARGGEDSARAPWRTASAPRCPRFSGRRPPRRRRRRPPRGGEVERPPPRRRLRGPAAANKVQCHSMGEQDSGRRPSNAAASAVACGAAKLARAQRYAEATMRGRRNRQGPVPDFGRMGWAEAGRHGCLRGGGPARRGGRAMPSPFFSRPPLHAPHDGSTTNAATGKGCWKRAGGKNVAAKIITRIRGGWPAGRAPPGAAWRRHRRAVARYLV